ncbi:MAG: SHOCT domain-containing protein [Oscillospiraceae bacterium]
MDNKSGNKKIKFKPSKTYSIFGFAVGIIFMITGLVMMFKQHSETGSYNLEFWGMWLGACAVITVMNYLNAFTKKGIPIQEAIIESENHYQKQSTKDIETKLKQLNSLHQQNLVTQEEFDKKKAELLEKL